MLPTHIQNINFVCISYFTFLLYLIMLNAKVLEDEDGSITSTSKIYDSILCPCLAMPINCCFDSFSQMKRPLRTLFSILLLAFLAVTLIFTITFHGCGFFASLELEYKNIFQEPAQDLNSTLLHYAAIDIGEEQFKKDIERLLKDDFDGKGRQRAFAMRRRFHHDVKSRSSSYSSAGIPIQYLHDFRRNLNDWARKKKFQADVNHVMNDLVRLVKHSIDKHNGLMGSDKKYESCAVVGNGGILLNSNYGDLIDSHEMVIRLNNAWIQRFEQHVGSKTGLSFVNSNILHLCSRRERCFCHPYGDNVPMIMYICQAIHFLDYTRCNGSHKAPLLITDPRFDMLCSRIVKYYSLKRFLVEMGRSLQEWGPAHEGPLFHYSSGMQAVMLALGICDKVSIFGFGKSAGAKHHYHTNQKTELGLHDYEAEYVFYQDLVKNQQAIPFISDEFKIPPVVIYH